MQNKKLQQALKDITESINSEIKHENPRFNYKTSDKLMIFVNPYIRPKAVSIYDCISIASTLSDKDQIVDFVLGMLNKAYSEQNIYQSILFSNYESAVNSFTITEHRLAQSVVEMCSDTRFVNPNPQLYSVLSTVVKNFAGDFTEPLHVQLLEEAKLVCLTKLFLAMQAEKQDLK
ncbi:TPA: hypothetical protein N2952_002109 [Vibrio parahaemolyticus]|uniref:Uncharacterized protein n=1 Tax=Vibrio parahaemolyticus TaxID=670 RepID=A0A227JIE9_VIBPH|nr:hypothetical protein [Vibrio parahaemolyticus]EGR0405535.1 hypothetical protein [Vibrio parahaemolyticus]ELJ8803462.1 hypothetical protein [Vibrio parahaemolyticus]ETX23589.1 hypothetical protein D037_2734 [Vibrio parahaemolyticus IDH02640]OXE34840.1 hypothetical protein CA163_00300 [Vibrio parahaemolyticus]HAS6844233.1 hypothetical protein [Vibrio parahaemolyticus]